jgi:PAS domain S-box-containing protein
MPYRLQDLIDLDHFQHLQDRLNNIYSFPSAIIDNDGHILTATAWQEVCTQFHRKNPECERDCIHSDRYILEHLHEANPAVTYRCPRGLVDNATPIIIDGVHYGNFFTGQFFLEPPNLEFFRAQARQFGFDEEAYLDAVRRVPVWKKEQLDHYLFFIKGLIAVIAESGLKTLREIETRQQIEDSIDRADTILREMHDGFWIADTSPRGMLVDANDAMCRMLGYTREELIGMSVANVVVDDSPEVVAERIRTMMISGSAQFESRFRRKDGSIFDVQVSITYLPKRQLFFCFHRDITEQKRASEAVRESEQRFRSLVESAPDAVYVQSGGRFVYLNPTACKLFGVARPEELLGKDLMERVAPEFRGAIRERIQRQKETGQPAPLMEQEYLRVDGSRVPVETTAMYIRYEGLDAHLVYVRDITDRRRLAEQYRQAQKMESVGRLAAGVAHDFNNQLTVIRAYCDLLMADVKPESPLWNPLMEIRRASDRAKSTTSHLLSFSRKQILQAEVVDLNQLLKEMRNPTSKMVGEDIELEVVAAPGATSVLVDRAAMQQAIMNLIVNARDAMSAGGRLTLRSAEVTVGPEEAKAFAGAPPGRYVLLEVADTGAGMDAATLGQVFDPFFTTKEVGKGTGLGLPMVHGFVSQSSGYISIDSAVGQGTTVRLLLPVAEKQARASAAEATAPLARGQATETVLVVEDEETIRQIMIQVLRAQGYRVLDAASPMEALNLLAGYSGPLHLLISDMVMPGMRGVDLARQVQAKRPEVRTLFITGYVEEPVRKRANNVLLKPFGLDSLTQRVRQTLDAPAQAGDQGS